MYRVDRNNFYKNQKSSTIYTPNAVSEFLFSIVHGKVDPAKIVLDPCVGKGSLLLPFLQENYHVLGLDIVDQKFPNTLVLDYLEIEENQLETPGLIIMNPPFNITPETRENIRLKHGKRPLLPEIWLIKSLELFGNSIPIILFTPYGFRLNLTCKSARWQRFLDHTYPEIQSIISLPKNVFENILFHSEILIFNIEGLKAHYFISL